MDATVEEIENLAPELPNTIRIKALGFENIVPTYPVADVTMKFELADVVLGESEKTHVSSYKFVPTDYEIAIPCDLTAQSDLNRLISFPITITVTETVKEVSMSKIDLSHVQSKEKSQSDISRSSISSSKSKSNSKTEKKSKDKKGKPKDKKEQKSKKGRESLTIQNEAPTGPLVVGMAMLDLLPIFLGATEFSQELYVRQVTKEFGEKAIAVADLPKLRVTITLDGPSIDVEKSCVMHISVESIFNIPSLLTPNYCYQLSIILPLNSDDFESIDFNEGTHTVNGDFIRYKFWPAPNAGKPHLESTYRIDNDLSTIVNRNNVNLDMNNVTKSRIEYNVLQRVFLMNESKERIFKHLRNFRKIPVEIYVTPSKPDASQPGSAPEKKRGSKAAGKKDKGDKARNSTATTKSKSDSACLLGDPSEFLHLMAIVNVDNLLYPGVKTCRIACPISTYHEKEILTLTGVTNSHFRPKAPQVSEEKLVKEKKGDKKKEKASKKDSKGSKSSKGSKKSKESKDSKKSGKGKKGKTPETRTVGVNLAEKLPPGPPPEPEPSIQVFNDLGEPSFLLIEFTFSKPVHAERQLEDLSNKLSTIVRGIPALPRYLISSSVAQEMFNETVRALTKDINYQYLQFIEEQTLCKCEHIPDFLTYLQQSGAYQTYMASITRALATLIPEKYQFQTDAQGKCSKEYQSFIKYVHTDMVRQTNKVINEFVICNLNKIPHKHLVKNEELLLYAKEATEMGEYNLAERYYLERICCDENNANFWFDFAIFHMEMKNVDNVIQCLKEVLSLDSSHRYSLLMYGLILYEKGKAAEAETCLLTLTLMHPRWPEGWGGLFTYYHSVQNIEGMELALQMANKYISGAGDTADYFNAVDDLAWSTQLCLDDIYSKTAVLLIKMRLNEPTETLINLTPQHGVREYLMAVLAYYNKNYYHSLQHLENAKEALGLNHGICSLIGHCFLKINNHSNALIFYEMVLPMYNRPDDIHLAYLFGAICYDTTGNWQKARKLALLACKYSPTPQTWMHAGSYYFKQNDLLSAEQCLVQANLCDNRLPEPWTYLALINVHLGKKYETELCLSQAKKFSAKDLPLIANVEKIIESMNT